VNEVTGKYVVNVSHVVQGHWTEV